MRSGSGVLRVREVFMLHIARRVGIAIGSLVAAWLVVSLVGGTLLPLVGVPFRPGTSTAGGALVALVTVVLGGLIYRDILRRERRTH